MDDRILELLRDLAFDLETPDPKRHLLSEIQDLGDQAVPLLVEALRHGDPLIRKMAAFALGLLGWSKDGSLDLEAAVPHLEAVLKADTDPEVRRQAAEALWSICEHEVAVQAFLDGLHDEDVEARRWGATMLCLAGKKAPSAIQLLIDALDDPDLIVRRYVADALAMHGMAAVSALPKLEALLGEDEWTRVIGVQAILTIDPSRTEELSPVFAEALGSRSRLVRRQAVEATRELPNAGRLVVPELAEVLDDEDEAVRMTALNSLEHLGPAAAPAVPLLVTILRGDGRDGNDVLVRGHAVDVLAAIGEPAQEAVYFLLESMDEPGDDEMTTHFRLQVAQALWHVSGDPHHVLTRAFELVRNPNWWLRGRAAAALGDVGNWYRGVVVPDLRRLLKDEHPTVRRLAAESLERITGGSPHSEGDIRR